MDDLSASSPVERVIFMKGSRLGATECGTNWLGYVMHHAPGPMLLYQPTREMAQEIGEGRITALIETTPTLDDRVTDQRTFRITFAGGKLYLKGANAATGMRMIGARYLFLDELDGYPGEVGTKENPEGDPVALAETRTTEYEGIRKLFYASTPTLKGFSRIERYWLASDRRRYFLRCLVCGHWDWLQWRPGGISGDEGEHHTITWDPGRPETAAFRCVSCREQVPESEKPEMLKEFVNAEWRPTRDEERDGPGDGSHGYRLSGLYSPWRTWSDCAEEFQAAKADPLKLKVWVNHAAAETWEEKGTSAKPGDLLARARREPPREGYDVPNGVGILVMAVDVQANRLEPFIWGWGAGEESWLIAFEPIVEDPGGAKAWIELEALRTKVFRHQSGQSMRIERTVIDTRGGFAEQVYEYCSAHQDDVAHQVHAIYGIPVRGKNLVERFTVKNKFRVKTWPLCVNTGKATVLSRLQIADPGPGYVHLPPDVDEEFVQQLVAEKGVRKYVAGEGWVTVYKKIRDRNEAFDGFVYATAALHTTGRPFIATLGKRAEQFAKPPEPPAAPKPESPLAPILRRPRRNWVTGWRR